MIFERKFSEVLLLEDQLTEVINTKNFLWFSDTIVETGACSGGGIDRFLNAGFTDIRSVELQQSWYNYTSSRFANNPKVKIWYGDSREKLAEMLPNKPAVVILDAHPAGEGTAGHEDLIKKEALGIPEESDFFGDNIISKEIEIIKKSGHNHLIIVDDQSSINPNWVKALPNHDHELVNKKYLVFIPKNSK